MIVRVAKVAESEARQPVTSLITHPKPISTAEIDLYLTWLDAIRDRLDEVMREAEGEDDIGEITLDLGEAKAWKAKVSEIALRLLHHQRAAGGLELSDRGALLTTPLADDMYRRD